jgi:hypothetical protein
MIGKSNRVAGAQLLIKAFEEHLASKEDDSVEASFNDAALPLKIRPGKALLYNLRPDAPVLFKPSAVTRRSLDKPAARRRAIRHNPLPCLRTGQIITRLYVRTARRHHLLTAFLFIALSGLCVFPIQQPPGWSDLPRFEVIAVIGAGQAGPLPD